MSKMVLTSEDSTFELSEHRSRQSESNVGRGAHFRGRFGAKMKMTCFFPRD